MLHLLFILLAAAGASADCPSDVQPQFMTCLMPMRSVMSARPNSNMVEACGKIHQALQCIDTIVTECRDNPAVQSMIQGMRLDNMRSMCAMYTGSNGDDSSGCPPDALPQIETCMSDLTMGSSAHNGPEACRKMTSGFQCLESLVGVCQGNRNLQGFLQHLNMDHMRSAVTSACSTPAASGPPTVCDETRPAKALRRCTKKMISSRIGKKRPTARCRAVLAGFQCLRDLLTRCPDDPIITQFTTLGDLDSQEASVARTCQQIRLT